MTPIKAVGDIIRTKINDAGAYIQNKFSGSKTTEQNRAQNQKDINNFAKAATQSQSSIFYKTNSTRTTKKYE